MTVSWTFSLGSEIMYKERKEHTHAQNFGLIYSFFVPKKKKYSDFKTNSNMDLRGFTKEVILSKGILVHDFENELVLATRPWILHPEGESFIPCPTPTTTYIICQYAL